MSEHVCEICNLNKVQEQRFCGVCQTNLDNGYYAVIGMDERLSTMESPWRTGVIMWVEIEAVGKLFNTDTLEVMVSNNYVYAIPGIIDLLQALEEGREEEVNARLQQTQASFCQLCKETKSFICDRYNDPRCAQHISN